MVIKGDIGYLELEVLTIITSGSNDFWEENWLYTLVNGTFPGFTAKYECNLRTDDFQRCYYELLDLLNSKSDFAKFTTVEEGVELSFSKDISGSIVVKGKLVGTELTRCSLEFNFVTDVLTVNNFSLQIQSLLLMYPIIGTP